LIPLATFQLLRTLLPPPLKIQKKNEQSKEPHSGVSLPFQKRIIENLKGNPRTGRSASLAIARKHVV
jgi:hypothetical protein